MPVSLDRLQPGDDLYRLGVFVDDGGVKHIVPGKSMRYFSIAKDSPTSRPV